ncbi:oxidoreductase [Sphingomonas sp. BK069]|uniref:oxidoreductase n=1 Tax=Sphingomonas sp. BK069 TaxID=2586979 RepID=UPI001616D097|nr:oxidoreductase [Sphingomonas sp. BK069]MBB3347140.1 putative dehydrogenase [Sphingomonas sp. BK069]
MTDRIGVGLIGYGLGGRAFHAPYIATTPGLELRGIVSRDPAKVHADWSAAPVLPDVAGLLDDESVTLVVVSSPDHLHVAHAEAALAAGKHVLVDKPFATSLTEARGLIAAVERAGRLLTVFHNRRWDADFLTLRGLIEDGTLGDVVSYESRFDRWRPAPAATWKEARAGGSWLDLGPHLVDQALLLFGRPSAVTADIATLRRGAPAPDYFHATLRYPDKRVTLHSSKLAADHGLRLAVHGTRGSWVKHGLDPQEAATLAGQRPGGAEWGHDPLDGLLTPGEPGAAATRVPNRRGDYRLFWSALAAAIRGEGPNPVPPNEALAVMEVLDAGLRSVTERCEIVL